MPKTAYFKYGGEKGQKIHILTVSLLISSEPNIYDTTFYPFKNKHVLQAQFPWGERGKKKKKKATRITEKEKVLRRKLESDLLGNDVRRH